MTNQDDKHNIDQRNIWLDDRLNNIEKYIFVLIFEICFGNSNRCNTSDARIAKFCQCNEDECNKAIEKLEKLGYIEIVRDNGTTRIIRCCPQ